MRIENVNQNDYNKDTIKKGESLKKGDLIMMVKNKNGYELNFEATVDFMIDEIREKLHNEIAPCTEQEFLSAYEEAHEKATGEEWELSKENPRW